MSIHDEVVPFSEAKTVLLFDSANTIYRTIQKDIVGLRTSDGRPSGYIYGFDMNVKRIWSSFRGPATSLVFGWDAAEAKQVRRKMLPEYKLHRDDRPDLFMERFGLPKKQVFEDIKEYTETLPHHRLESPNAEFDDLAAAIIRENPKKHFILISNDKDLWQLLTLDNVMIVGSMGVVIGQAELEKAFGLTDFNQVFLHKALFGDPSDNIPTVLPRVIKKGIVEEVIKPLAGIDHEPTSVIEKLLGASSKKAQELCREYGFEDKLETNMKVVGFVAADVKASMAPLARPSASAYSRLMDRYEIRG